MVRQSRLATDITTGIDPEGLAGLTADQARIVALLLARAAERSYRRGVQQGAVMACDPGRLHPELAGWRYGESTDLSPWADSLNVEPAVDRLICENPGLGRLLEAFGAPFGIEGWRLATLAMERADGLNTGIDGATASIEAEIRALGVRLHKRRGSAMVDAFDDAIEIAGEHNMRGVSALWEGIGGWSA